MCRARRSNTNTDSPPLSPNGAAEVAILGPLGRPRFVQRAAIFANFLKNLRIFENADGKFDRSVVEIGGAVLLVSQFTLLGDCAKGRRPSFINAEAPEQARAFYERALVLSREWGVPTQGGVFQAHMQVKLVNDGPVTFTLEV